MSRPTEPGDQRAMRRDPSLLSRWIESQHQPRYRYAAALAIVVAATGVSALLFELGDPENLVMVYLLGVVLAAIRLGRGPSVFATVGGFACFLYFFVPHYYSFVLADLYYLPTFVIMLTVAFVVSTLTSKVQSDAAAMEERERRSTALYELSRDLAACDTRQQVAVAVDRHVAAAFACGGSLVELVEGNLVPFVAGAAMPVDAEQGAMRVALASKGGMQLHGALAKPLVVANEPVGLLLCDGMDLQLLRSDAAQRLLESFANNIAVAMHRVIVGEHAISARQRAEEERLRNVMLSSVSHDLRTPLASITGAATTLIDDGAAIDDATRLDLVQSIRQDADALERHVRNMLDLTRLESGGIAAQRDWHSVEEVVGCAMRRVESLFVGREVRIAVDASIPLVAIDATLVEQLLVNLLENAAKYSPAQGPVEVTASMADGILRLVVADRGPGVSEADRERVFAKFERGASSRAKSGAGLGLAICRAVAALHGGSVSVHAREGGGASFVVELPCAAASDAARMDSIADAAKEVES
jgi:two-component system sensor histidine kinase KdpD